MADHIGQRAAHQALDGDDGVQGILRLRRKGLRADLAPATVQVTHGRRQDGTAAAVHQAVGNAMAHRGDQRVRRAEIDADRDTARVRVGRLAGFGNLQQGHGSVVKGVDAFGQIGAKAGDEHQRSHPLGGLRRRRWRVEQAAELAE